MDVGDIPRESEKNYGGLGAGSMVSRVQRPKEAQMAPQGLSNQPKRDNYLRRTG